MEVLEKEHSEILRNDNSSCTNEDGMSNGAISQAAVYYSERDSLKLRNMFFKIVEEMRMRRSSDIETDKKIEHLMNLNQQYQQELEEERQKYTDLEKALQLSEKRIKEQFIGKLQRLEEEKVKLEVTCAMNDKKCKGLADEIRSLHMNKHSSEKKLNELVATVTAHDESRDISMRQLEEMERQCLDLSSQVGTVSEQIVLLQANVTESTVLNRKLSIVNDHQKCVMESLKKELRKKSEELVEVKTKAHARVESNQSFMINNTLKEELKMQKDLSDKLKHQIDCLQTEHYTTLQSLKEAHRLTDKHVIACNKALDSEAVFKAKVKELSSTLEATQLQLAYQRQETMITCEKETTRANSLNETTLDLSQRLKALQGDYSTLLSAHDALGVKLQDLTSENYKIKSELQECKEKTVEHPNDPILAVNQTDVDMQQSCESTMDHQKQLANDALSLQHQSSQRVIKPGGIQLAAGIESISQKNESEDRKAVNATPFPHQEIDISGKGHNLHVYTDDATIDTGPDGKRKIANSEQGNEDKSPKRIKVCNDSEIDPRQVDDTSKLHVHVHAVSNGQCEVSIAQRDENEKKNLTSIVNNQQVPVDTPTAENVNKDQPIILTEAVSDESTSRKSSLNNMSHLVQSVRLHNAFGMSEDDRAIKLTFSDDENSADDPETAKLVSQIDRVQSYLKKDRLKRTK